MTTATPSRPSAVRPAPLGQGSGRALGQDRPPPPGNGRRQGPGPLLWAEAALTLLTLTAVLGLARLVQGGGYLGAVLACTLGAHGLAIVARRLRWPPLVLGLTGVLGLIVVLGIVHVPGTTFWGIPTPATLHELRQQLANAGPAFQGAAPPAPVEPGYVVAWAGAAWIVALTADAAAFRARATFESLVPAGALFVFASALGTSRGRLPATVAYLAATLLAWLTQRLVGRADTARWVGSDGGSGLRAVAGVGGVVILGAVAVTALIGPHLPGAADAALIHWNGHDPDSSGRVTISPLVDIRTRLVNQSSAEVFTVTSTVRSYWRLTALDDFDGRVWSSNNRYTPVDGRFDGTEDAPAADTERDVQTFHISQLASAWLPAAYRPVAVNGVSARNNADTSTLLADHNTTKGQQYRVVSEVPIMTAAELSAARAPAPDAIEKADTALPDHFPARVTALAKQIVGNASSPYQKALRLQDYLRSDLFTYDLSVGPGQSSDALERFLFVTRRGYCEQFSGAFAAMARAVGLPARVAVGFTPGDQTGPDTYQVLGLHGHAWPEVYITGYGWVAFEPTPGRGIPNGTDYTGVPDQQASGNGATDPTGANGLPTLPLPDTTGTTQPTAGTASTSGLTWIARALVVLAVLLALPLVWLLGLEGARRVLRQRRRDAASEPADRVVVAWQEASAALLGAGVRRDPSETPDQFAARLAEDRVVSPGPVAELASTTTAAVYARGSMSEAASERAAELAESIDAEVNHSLRWWRRWLVRIDPRTLWASPG